MFSESVTSSLHQGEMCLQKCVHVANQARRGQPLSTHRAQSCGLSVGRSSPHPLPRPPQTTGSAAPCASCVCVFIHRSRMRNSTSEKYIGLGSPWWSRGKDSALPMWGKGSIPS